jgi:Arc/MetJ-type ribon-helix-helix transcriptional regulator
MPSPSSINVSLPPSLRKWVDAQVRDGDYETPGEYLKQLISRERESLEQSLEDGLRSPAIVMNPAEWRKIKDEVRRRVVRNRAAAKPRRKSA